jgi:hypothetical protein
LKKRKKAKVSPEPAVSTDKGKGKVVESVQTLKVDAASTAVAASA